MLDAPAAVWSAARAARGEGARAAPSAPDRPRRARDRDRVLRREPALASGVVKLESVRQPLPVVRSDAELVAQARAGDAGAFAALVDRHQDALVGYLARLSGSAERAEELAQETFVRVHRTLGRYREQGRFAAWLYRVATNAQRSEERRLRRWRAIAPVFAASSLEQSDTAVDRLLELELQRQLRHALARLPLRFRAPLVLHELEGLSVREVAQVVGCAEGTVKSRLARARARLRSDLAPYWNGDPT